jgi:hypothetical protein
MSGEVTNSTTRAATTAEAPTSVETTTTTTAENQIETGPLSVEIDDGVFVDVPAAAWCDAADVCSETQAAVPDVVAGDTWYAFVLRPRDAVGRVQRVQVVEPDWLRALPRRDGSWIVGKGCSIDPVDVAVRVQYESGSATDYRMRVACEFSEENVQFFVPHRAARTLPPVDAAAYPADLPTDVFGYRAISGNVVRWNRVTGDELVLANVEPVPDASECVDSCGVYHVSPTVDGRRLYFGGPGPAVGTTYAVPTDGSGEMAPFSDGNSVSTGSDGQVVVSGFGAYVFDGASQNGEPVFSFDVGSLGGVSAALSVDAQRLIVMVGVIDTEIVSIEFRSGKKEINPIANFANANWQHVAERADGMLVLVRGWAGEDRPFVVDILDPAIGEIVDSIELDAEPAGGGGWIDFDATGRYLLFTGRDGVLRWTDFAGVGTLGEGWGDAGW